MSISVQELDNTVRALFEGKGAVVSRTCLLYTAWVAEFMESVYPPWSSGDTNTDIENRLAKPSTADFDRSKRIAPPQRHMN